MESSPRSGEERRYVHLDPETVLNVAESLGISNLGTNVAKELAEDATFRLREVADVCSRFLRHSRKRKLTTDIVNKAFKVKNIEPVIGHKKSRIIGCDSFEYLPEGEIFVESEREINLVSESLQTSQPIEESQITVSASWISLQGVSLSGNTDEGKVNPCLSSLPAVLVQYYTTVTGCILGDSEQLCLSVLQDLRSNARLTPLLPYLVTFSRVCLNRYKENSLITARLIRLISSLFSNPHLNLSPKPYLSYLVSALLGFLIKENKDLNPVEHVQLAATVLSQALRRWATPTNQLRAQTLKALRDNCGNHLAYSQYGSISSLCILGPQVLEECLLPQYETLLSSLWSVLKQEKKRGVASPSFSLGQWSLGLLKTVGTMLIRHWRSNGGDYKSIKNLYSLLDVYFGDSLVPFITSSGVGRAMKSVEPGKLRIRRLRRLQNSQPVAARPEHVDLFGDPRNLDRGMFSAQEDFNYLADMGVPSDIFETAEVEQGGRQENGENNGFFKPRIINISKSTLVQFPDARPFKMKPRAIRLNMGPCRQIEPERYSQKRFGMVERGRRMVPWRNLVVGGRRGEKSSTTLPDYIQVLALA